MASADNDTTGDAARYPPSVLAAPPADLSDGQAFTYHPAVCRGLLLRQGFVGAFKLTGVTAEEVDGLAQQVIRSVKQAPKRVRDFLRGWHEHNATARKICHDPALLRLLEDAFGRKLLCYQTEMFVQFPKSGYYSTLLTHRDAYFDITHDDPYPHFSVQVALTHSTPNNCLSVIPDSHRETDEAAKLLPAFIGGDVMVYKWRENKTIRFMEKVDALMAPGEFFLFSNYILHHAYLSQDVSPYETPRVGMTIRFAHPSAELNRSHWNVSPKPFFVGVGDDDAPQAEAWQEWRRIEAAHAKVLAKQRGANGADATKGR